MLIGRVVALQDHLGALHDMHVASGLAAAFVEATPGLSAAEREAIVRFGRQLDKDAARLQGSVGTAWKPIVAAGYRRALGRAIARL
jgi:CHAD domain-containing protein